MGRSTPSRQAVALDDEAVVLAGDLDLAGREVFDRVVGAAMASAFSRFGAQGAGQKLMPQADAENGMPAFRQP